MNVVKRGHLYPLADRLTYAERERYGMEREPVFGYGPPREDRPVVKMMARYTGEKRPPRKGEWYLSGSEVEAYRAPNDLSTAYHIAKLVKVREKLVRVVEELPCS